MTSAELTEPTPTGGSLAGAAPTPPWRKVLALVGGQGISLAGDFVLLIAMAWTAVQLGGAGAVTTLVLAATIPRTIMLVVGGPVADTVGPHVVLLRTTLARALLLAIGAVVVASVHALWPLVIIAALEGALLGFASPSAGSIMPSLATGDQLARANSLWATVARLAPIVGAPFGAWLIAAGALWPAMLLVSVVCLVSLACIVYVTRSLDRPIVPDGPGQNLLRRSGDGVRLLAGYARLRWIFVCAFCLDLAFGWPIEVALPVLVKQRGWGVGAIGVVVAAFSAGALISGAVGTVLAHRIPLMVRLVLTGVGIAAGIVAMAMMPSVAALAAVGAAVGLMSGLNGPAIVTVYQQAAPKHRMGTAMSTLTLAGIGTGPTSIALFGALALVLGLHTTWLVCGVVALVGPLAAVLALRHPVVEPPAPAPPPARTEPSLSATAA